MVPFLNTIRLNEFNPIIDLLNQLKSNWNLLTIINIDNNLIPTDLLLMNY